MLRLDAIARHTGLSLLLVAVVFALLCDLSTNVTFNPARSLVADLTPEGPDRVRGFAWMQTVSGGVRRQCLPDLHLLWQRDPDPGHGRDHLRLFGRTGPVHRRARTRSTNAAARQNRPSRGIASWAVQGLAADGQLPGLRRLHHAGQDCPGRCAGSPHRAAVPAGPGDQPGLGLAPGLAGAGSAVGRREAAQDPPGPRSGLAGRAGHVRDGLLLCSGFRRARGGCRHGHGQRLLSMGTRHGPGGRGHGKATSCRPDSC